MKITSLVTSGVLEFNDLGSYIKSVSPVLRSVRLSPGQSTYLVETSDVLLSTQSGDIHRFLTAGKISINDHVILAAGASVTLNHNFGFQPIVSVVNAAGVDFSDSTDVVITHTLVGGVYATTTVTSTAGGTFDIRLG